MKYSKNTKYFWNVDSLPIFRMRHLQNCKNSMLCEVGAGSAFWKFWILQIKIRVSGLCNLYFSTLRLFEKWCQWADVQIAKIPRMRRIKKSPKFENMQILRNRRIRKPETTRILRFLKHENFLIEMFDWKWIYTKF